MELKSIIGIGAVVLLRPLFVCFSSCSNCDNCRSLIDRGTLNDISIGICDFGEIDDEGVLDAGDGFSVADLDTKDGIINGNR